MTKKNFLMMRIVCIITLFITFFNCSQPFNPSKETIEKDNLKYYHSTENIPDWKPFVYYNAGDLVVYKNIIWQCIYAHMAYEGWVPDIPGLNFWKVYEGQIIITPTNSPVHTPVYTPTSTQTQIPTPTISSEYKSWDPLKEYWKGDIVTHKGKIWRAKHWTRNEEPGSAHWIPWEEINIIKTPTTTPTLSPTIYPTSTINPTRTVIPTGIPAYKGFFDDFSYDGIIDPRLLNFKWILRNTAGGPGPSGCSWSENNISFIPDPQNSSNKLLRLTSSTDGTGSGTSQAEIYHQRKFFEGTYAARVRFTDEPVTGPDGDQIVETFFTITPLNFNNDPNYSEIDFEYLANGGWGPQSATLWETTWETYCADPWSKDNIWNAQETSHQGWHSLVFTVAGNEVKYYVDGELRATHGEHYYPEGVMSINFNLWFINTGLLGTTQQRVYVQDVDWVFHAKNTVLSPEQVENSIINYRNSSITNLDEIQ